MGDWRQWDRRGKGAQETGKGAVELRREEAREEEGVGREVVQARAGGLGSGVGVVEMLLSWDPALHMVPSLLPCRRLSS